MRKASSSCLLVAIGCISLCVCVCVCVCIHYLKFRKHQSLVQQISGSGYKRQFFRIVGFSERKAKHLAKYCSIVFIIESRHIWRRRCRVYPLDLLCCCIITADWVTCLNHVWAINALDQYLSLSISFFLTLDSNKEVKCVCYALWFWFVFF